MAARSDPTIIETEGQKDEMSERNSGFSSPPPPGFARAPSRAPRSPVRESGTGSAESRQAGATSPSFPYGRNAVRRDEVPSATPATGADRSPLDRTVVEGFDDPGTTPVGEVDPRLGIGCRTTLVYADRPICGWFLSDDRRAAYALVSGTNLVGRDVDNEVVINDNSVSGLQCNVICEEAETLLMPRPEARNPSEINGRRIYQTTTIPPFSTVRFGCTVWTYVPASLQRSEDPTG